MQKSTLLFTMAASLAGAVLSTDASAACSIYFSNSRLLQLAQKSETVLEGPFTTKCTPASITSSTSQQSSNLILKVVVQKQVSGVWSDASVSGSYSANTTGTFRYLGRNTGGAGSVNFSYSHP